ncbi:MAG: AsnC family transcriptional regulator [Bdellovibrionota bacterium]
MSSNLVKLDKIDLQILRELDDDSSKSYAEIGRLYKIPAETVRYKIKSLVSKGVIADFFTVIDLGKLGYGVHKVMLKLHNVNEDKVTEALNFLSCNKNVNWVARFDGKFDIGFTIQVRYLRELSEFVDILKNKYHNYISKLSFAVNIEADFLTREYLLSKKTRKSGSSKYTTPDNPASIDSIDREILQVISSNPRAAATEIATKTELTSETVAQRIRKLEKQKIITGYKISLNTASIDVLNYYLLINLHYVSAERIAELIEYCRAHPSITYVIKALGEWDYEINLEVPSVRFYRDSIMELTRKFSDIIRDYEGLHVDQVHKFCILPT